MNKFYPLIVAFIIFCITSIPCLGQEKSNTKPEKNIEEIEIIQEIPAIKDDSSSKLLIEPRKAKLFSFATSSSTEISDGFKEYLDEVVKYMKENPDCVLGIVGHSDNDGTLNQNYERSDKRAQEVVRHMTFRGIPIGRLLTTAKGSLEPIAPNATEEGRKRNRRVEIEIIPSAKQMQYHQKGKHQINK